MRPFVQICLLFLFALPHGGTEGRKSAPKRRPAPAAQGALHRSLGSLGRTASDKSRLSRTAKKPAPGGMRRESLPLRTRCGYFPCPARRFLSGRKQRRQPGTAHSAGEVFYPPPPTRCKTALSRVGQRIIHIGPFPECCGPPAVHPPPR